MGGGEEEETHSYDLRSRMKQTGLSTRDADSGGCLKVMVG